MDTKDLKVTSDIVDLEKQVLDYLLECFKDSVNENGLKPEVNILFLLKDMQNTVAEWLNNGRE